MRGWPNNLQKAEALREQRRKRAKEQGLGTKVTCRGSKWSHPSPRRGKTHLEQFGEEKALRLSTLNSEAHKDNLSLKTIAEYRKGKTVAEIFGEEKAKEVIEKNRQSHIGLPCPRKGLTDSEFLGEEKAKQRSKRLSESHKGLSIPKSEEQKKNNSMAQLKYWEDKKNPDNRTDYRYRAWNAAVKQLYNSTCQDCGITEEELKKKGKKGKHQRQSIHCHHKKCWDLYIDQRYVVSNGITYCSICHAKLERKIARNNARRMKEIEEYLSSEIKPQSVTEVLEWMQNLIDN